MADRLKLASITLVRDEAPIVEAFLRHNIRFLDRMFIVDDGSRDATSEIIALLRQEGLNIVAFEQAPSASFQQSERMSAALVRVLADCPWNAIVPLDADEFISADSRAAFEQDLIDIPIGSVGGLSPIHYVLSSRDNPDIENPLVRIRHGYDAWPNPWKVVVPGALARLKSVSFAEGNHSFHINGVTAPIYTLQRTRLIHFRARTADEMVAESIVRYARRRSREDRGEGLSVHWMKMVHAIREVPSLTVSADEAARLASRFCIGMESEELVHIPFDASHAVTRFKHLAGIKPYQMIVGTVDDLVDANRATALARDEAIRAAEKLETTLAMTLEDLERIRNDQAVANEQLANLTGSARGLSATAWALVCRRLRDSVAKLWRRKKMDERSPAAMASAQEFMPPESPLPPPFGEDLRPVTVKVEPKEWVASDALQSDEPGRGEFLFWIDFVYRHLLGRGPESAGASFWLTALENGMPFSEMARQVGASPEAGAYQQNLQRSLKPDGSSASNRIVVRLEEM